MAIIVQKFGGTSVATPELREAVAEKVLAKKRQGNDVVVVISAMGRQGQPYATDTLISLLDNEHGVTSKRDLDMIMACGEIISSTIMAGVLRKAGLQVVVLTGWQAGIVSDDTFGDARIITVEKGYLQSLLSAGFVPVVCGFQAATDSGDITTLGRGGSDTTAAALGVALGAEAIEIFTDVKGIMTADPRIVPEARVIDALEYSELFQMAYEGSKVIHPRAVELAMQRSIPILVRSTAGDCPGTLITNKVHYEKKKARVVTGIAHVKNLAQVMVETPEEDAALEYQIFRVLAEAGVSVDLINVGPREKKFIISDKLSESAQKALEPLTLAVRIRTGCAKVSVVGSGMRGVPGVMATVVAALREAAVPILQTSDSHLTISILIDEGHLERALKTLHGHFDLNRD
jgi:aspartate kinase